MPAAWHVRSRCSRLPWPCCNLPPAMPARCRSCPWPRPEVNCIPQGPQPPVSPEPPPPPPSGVRTAAAKFPPAAAPLLLPLPAAGHRMHSAAPLGHMSLLACVACVACAAALGSAPDVLGHARFPSKLRAAHAAVVCKLFPRLICYFFVRLIPGLVLLCPLRTFFCGCPPFIFPITCSFRVCHFQKLLSKTARPHHAGRACVVFIPFFRPSGFPPRPPCCSSPQRGFFSKILAGARPAPPHFRRCSPAP